MNALVFLLTCLVAVASAQFNGNSPTATGYSLNIPADLRDDSEQEVEDPFAALRNGYSYNGPDLTDVDEEVEDPLVALAANIPGGGVPGQDYPILASVPETDFSCEDVEFPGYYADTADEAGCQVFHICQEGGHQDSFLCPNGTVYHQQYFVCNWWFNVDCSASEDFYRLNEQIGFTPEDLALRETNGAPNSVYGFPREAGPSSFQYNYPQRA